MRVTSAARTVLTVDMQGASTVGIWCYTDKAGTFAHWPGGIVVSFLRANTVNSTLKYRCVQQLHGNTHGSLAACALFAAAALAFER